MAEVPEAVKAAKAAKEQNSENEKPVRLSSDKLKAKNIGEKVLNLTHGAIKPGEVGTATVAEIGNLHQYLKEA